MNSAQFKVSYNYEVHFIEGFLKPEQNQLANLLKKSEKANIKVLPFIDGSVAALYPDLESNLKSYFESHQVEVELLPFFKLHSGEETKNDMNLLKQAYSLIQSSDVDRHSYILAIGGGAAIDFAGYVASTAHRGLKLIRIPTTVLGQNDACIGVKNAINFNGVKNFLGNFATPELVINDYNFLTTLTDSEFFPGFAEAVKIALIKDPQFFSWLYSNQITLAKRENKAVQFLIQKTAELHMHHFSHSGDPFEKGNARPLDYGHWLAHKIESISQFEIRHGNAVGIGIFLDSLYACKMGYLEESDFERIKEVLISFHLLENKDILLKFLGDHTLLNKSLEEFRTHLGGELSIPLLTEIGNFFNTTTIDTHIYLESITELLHLELPHKTIQ